MTSIRRLARALTVTAIGLALVAAPRPARAQEHEHEHAAEHGPAERNQVHGHRGFPGFVDVFFTHHAYLERKLHPRFETTVSGEGREYEASGELVWQFAERLGGELEGAFVRTDPDEGDGESGFGDVEIAPMLALVQDPDRRLIVTVRSGFVLPTGDEQKGLGAGGWGWEPGLLVWKGFGPEGRGAFQTEIGYERIFADEGPDEEEAVYNFSLSYWLPSNWIPIVELNGVTPIGTVVDEEPVVGLVPAHGGAESEDTVVSATAGFRYAFANGQQWGAAIQVPLTGTESYDARIVVGGIIHLE